MFKNCRSRRQETLAMDDQGLSHGRIWVCQRTLNSRFVTQSFTLLYRRVLLCTFRNRNLMPTESRRYSRVKLCVTPQVRLRHALWVEVWSPHVDFSMNRIFRTVPPSINPTIHHPTIHHPATTHHPSIHHPSIHSSFRVARGTRHQEDPFFARFGDPLLKDLKPVFLED